MNQGDQNNRRKKTMDISMMPFGKVPPQARDAEEAVLGAIMLESDAYERVNQIIHSDVFYVDAHQRIYKAISKLHERRDPIDMIGVAEELRCNEDLEMVGGPYFLTTLTRSVISAAHIEFHARIMLQKYILREMIRIGGEMISRSYEDEEDVFSVLDTAEGALLDIRMKNIKKNFKKIQDVMIENMNKIEELRLQDSNISGVETKFQDLDFVTSGWQPTDLIILAARPSVGKTAFALTLAKNAALSYYEKHRENKVRHKGVGFFSLEMKDNQLVNRVLSAETGVWLWRFRNGKMDDDHMKQLWTGVEKLNRLNIFLDDTAGLTIQDFRSKAKIMVKKHDVGIIFVDYLQLMADPTKKNREQEISSISRQLKMTAKELDIPIIALSQLSREFQKGSQGSGKAPQLSDLRESGAIEQDADVVMFLYKPTDAEIAGDVELENIFYAGIEKHRNGASPVKFIGKFKKEIQSHSYLKVVDSSTLQPIGDSWKPVNTQVIQPPVKNYYEVEKTKEEDDLPF